MLPILAVGGVIGSIFSLAKGAAWLSDRLDASKGAASAGGKADAAQPAEATTSSFEASLAAQAAGQAVPTIGASHSVPATLVPQQHVTDYDELARVNAGFAAYGKVGHQTGTAAASAGSG